MKKLVVGAILSLTVLLSVAQSNTACLTFNGIPIEGSVVEFGNKLEENGFIPVEETDSTIALGFIGDVDPFGQCSVDLIPDPNTEEIVSVFLIIPVANNSWAALSAAYEKAKSSLEQQYGNSFFCTETFEGGDQPVTDVDKMRELEQGHCKYIAIYTSTGGSLVILTITYDEEEGGQVVVMYGNSGLGDLMSMALNGRNEKLEFEGLPIEGSMEDFRNVLLEKNFTQVEDYFFIGNLGEYGRCEVLLSSIPDTDQIGMYNVIFPKKDSNWAELSAFYFSLKEEFNRIYGEPKECEETFDTTEQPVTDSDKLQAVNDDKCRYNTTYWLPKGILTLSISHGDEGNQVNAFLMNEKFSGYFLEELSSHLKFMGIPIDGPLDSFVEKLESKGLREVPYFSQEGVTAMKGSFAGYRDCNIYVFHSEDKGTVNMVGVTFPDWDKWELLSSNYFSIKEKLIQKYGEPRECVEEFQSASSVMDDMTKMFFVETDRCKYESVFYTLGGVIKLDIAHIRVDYRDHCYVHLIYNDGINSLLERDDSIDDL